jgi:basic membrane lipoprotein Med (substrate-binding protein (PBP1-ABC) superfamily)
MMLIFILAATLAFFCSKLYFNSGKKIKKPTKEAPRQPEGLKQAVIKKKRFDDSKLRKVSITTNNILFDKSFNQNTLVASLLPILS